MIADPSGTLEPAPVIILVEPQMAENVGMAARAMANFGLSQMRLVAPRDGWPRKGAHQAASGAAHILDAAPVFDDVRAAIADLNLVLATSARPRGQMKRVLGPQEALVQVRGRIRDGQRVGILFGRERTGLENEEVSLCDLLVTFPADPAFASLNLAQAVLLVAYEWRRSEAAPAAPLRAGAAPATRAALLSFLDHLETALEGADYYPPDKAEIMKRNMRDIVHRMALSDQDLRSLRGALRALAGRPPGG